MKIAIVTQRYPDASQTPVHHHIHNLFGGNTVVICREILEGGNNERPAYQCPREGIWVHGLGGFTEGIINAVKGRSLRVPIGEMRAGLERFLKHNKVDAVLAEFGTEGLWCWPVVHEMRLPFFVYLRGYDATGFLHASRHRMRRLKAYQDMFSAADAVISVSPFLLRNLTNYGISISNGYVIPSGVDTALFMPAKKDYQMVLAVGRFIEKKAPHLTIEAFSAVSCRRPDLRLEMVGDGPLLEECKALARKLGLKDSVTFHGAQSHRFVQQLMSKAGLFMQHSVTASDGDQEGAPTSIQEAMASGACVISTYHAGIPDIVEDGVTGCLVRERDLTGYINKLAHLSASKSQCVEISQAARHFAVSRLDKSLSNKHIECLISRKGLPDWRAYNC